MTPAPTRYRRSSGALVRPVGDDLILTVRSREDFDRLSGTSAMVWRLLEGASSLDRLVAGLADLYAVEPAAIEDQVRRLVADLVTRGLVEEVRGPDA